MSVPNQAGALIGEIANNRDRPVLELSVQNHLSQCAAWGFLSAADLLRLAHEAGLDQHAACTISRAVEDIGDTGSKREVKAALPPTFKRTLDTYFHIQVCFGTLGCCAQRPRLVLLLGCSGSCYAESLEPSEPVYFKHFTQFQTAAQPVVEWADLCTDVALLSAWSAVDRKCRHTRNINTLIEVQSSEACKRQR